jgi:fumarylacetoacetate (FAA) hydrolase
MKLATLKSSNPDGDLVVVSRDGATMVSAAFIAPTLQAALDHWSDIAPRLDALSRQLNAGGVEDARPFQPEDAAAPLPRAWQWLDGSAFKAHSDLATRAYQLANTWHEHPLMYQGMSHQFLAPTEDAVFPDAADGIDFEGEFGVITDQVPMGADKAAARAHIRLVVQINDWSLRAIGREEMSRGFGWVRGKPACSVAPIAVTPDELGEAWRDAKVGLDLRIWRGDDLFGQANGREMTFGFDDLIAHAAYSRSLPAGTIVGSGTVANAAYKKVGSSCILERRGIEILDMGEGHTPFLAGGERVKMEARDAQGYAPFGRIDQRLRVLSDDRR